jgi:magnesium transporter
MCLSAKKSGGNLTDSHEEIELLLETYLKQIEEIANVASALTANMRTTEDIVNIMLDSQRNRLLLFELRLAMGTLGLTGGAFIASMFGMNLVSTLEQHPYAFFIVSGVAMGTAWAIFTFALRHMKLLVRQL